MRNLINVECKDGKSDSEWICNLLTNYKFNGWDIRIVDGIDGIIGAGDWIDGIICVGYRIGGIICVGDGMNGITFAGKFFNNKRFVLLIMFFFCINDYIKNEHFFLMLSNIFNQTKYKMHKNWEWKKHQNAWIFQTECYMGWWFIYCKRFVFFIYCFFFLVTMILSKIIICCQY